MQVVICSSVNRFSCPFSLRKTDFTKISGARFTGGTSADACFLTPGVPGAVDVFPGNRLAAIGEAEHRMFPRSAAQLPARPLASRFSGMPPRVPFLVLLNHAVFGSNPRGQ